MVQVLDPVPSFGQSLGRNLGAGLGAGLSQGMQQALQHKLALQQIESKERAKYAGKMDLYNAVRNQSRSPAEQLARNIPSKEDQVLDIVEKLRSQGVEVDDQQINEIYKSVEDSSQQMQQPQIAKPSIESIEDEEMALSLIDPSLGRQKTEQRKLRRKEFESEREFHTKRSNKFLDTITETANTLPEREVALDTSIAAVQSGKIKPLGGDFWADVLNAPQLRTQEGAALLAGAKVNLMGSLGRVGARPNQFLEKQISDAYARAGESQQAQMAKLNIAKTVLDLDKKFVEVSEEIANKYRQDLGYVPENIDSLARAQMKPYAIKRQELLSYQLQEGTDRENMKKNPTEFNSIKKVHPGTILTQEKYDVFLKKSKGATEQERDRNAIKMAKKAGYKIPDAATLGLE
jgi:hypothetical protein